MRKWFWDMIVGYVGGAISFILLYFLALTLVGKSYQLVAGVLFAGLVSVVVGYINYVNRTKEEDFKDINIKLSEKLDKIVFDEHIKMDSEIINTIKEMLEDIKRQNSLNEERIFEIWQTRGFTKSNKK